MRRPFRLALLLCAWTALALGGRIAMAQTPLFLVNERTQVRTIGFKFVEGQTFEPDLLKEQVALTQPEGFLGSVALQKKLSFIPFVPELGVHPFLPFELQKDAVRIERFYGRNGFLAADVDWLVRLDSAKNTVNILYTIREGPPLLLDSLKFSGPGVAAAIDEFPPELHQDWLDFRDRAVLQQGSRLTDFRLLQLQDQTLGWVRDQGYAFADVNAASDVDSIRNRASVTVFVDAGPRGRFSEIEVEGNDSVEDNVVTRELPFRVGDRYSYSKLVEGQRGVFGLNLFQIALADVPEDQPEDSTVVVRLRVREGNARIITGRAGYLSEAGIYSQAQWTHRNFFGGARTFNASATANTGLAAFATDPDIVYRASVSLRQPYFLNRRLSFSVSPFAETRNNLIDNSTAFGGNATLIYEVDQLKTASLQYGFETRNVREYVFTPTREGEISFIEISESELQNPGIVNRNTIGLSATYGEADDPVAPRLGYILRPSVSYAGPSLLSSVEYGRFGLTATGFVPVSDRIEFYGRVTGGWLTPFGGSLPDQETEGLGSLLRLRDAVFFGGGTSDVRGWGDTQLGPKLLDLRFAPEITEGADGAPNDTTLTFLADSYFPIGSLTKLSGTLEVRLPFPGLGPTFSTFVFGDAGRVWTTDERFDLEQAFLFSTTFSDAEKFFYSVGGGVGFATPVGALRFSIGYKLNPSFFDLRAPADLAEAAQRVFERNPGVDLADLEDEFEAEFREVPAFKLWGVIPESNRIHLHLSIGQTF